MSFNEFTNYMKENLESYQSFYDKALEYQQGKNRARQPTKRWNETKIERAIEQMWKKSMQVLYDKIKSQVDKNAYDSRSEWIQFMESNSIFETVNEGLAEIEFE